jgi:tetratricopeptide (TPR) repeat protein
MRAVLRTVGAMLLCGSLVGCAGQMQTWADEPLEAAKQQLLDAPHDVRTYLRLAELYAQRRDYLRAQQYVSLVESAAGSWSAIGIDAEKVFRLSISVAVRSQQYAEAVRRCKQRLEIEDEPEVRELYAALLEALGDEAEAERQRRLLILQHPEDPRLLIEAARFYERTSRADKRQRARALYDRYLTIRPDGEGAAKVRQALRSAQLQEELMQGH